MSCDVDTSVLDFLARLVAARSPNPPGDERAVAAAIAYESRALGLPEPEVHALAPERPNLIYRLGDSPPILLLAAHMDTVPPGDLSSWRTDPYLLARDGDRVAGLGAADMKAAIAASVHAAARIAANPPPAGTLVLVYSADEERGSAWGMEWLARAGIVTADAAVMLEPSSTTGRAWDGLYVAQRGSCVCWLIARGTPGHSSAPVPSEQRASFAFSQGLAALLAADPFEEFVHSVDGTRPTVNVATMVEGGFTPFAHPQELRAAVEVRVLEGMTKELTLDRLRNVVAQVGLGNRLDIELAEPPLDWIPPGETVSDPRLLSAANASWRKVFHEVPRHAVLPAGTDSSHVQAIGIPALPAFGPGTIGAVHQPNESIALSEIGAAVNLIEALVRAYLAEGEYDQEQT
jgi:acetylornithine deacetylase/succinyl-diaminopimelate desuccinylase-like protein